MNVKEAILQRRAYRSLSPVEISEEIVKDLGESARLFCSCFNNQPWRYVFVYNKETLRELHAALAKGNEWAQQASLIIAVFSRPELDCIIKERKYYLFDTGMATAAIILRATEMGLVAHPIAGFSPSKVKEVLDIPADSEVITLVIVGRHSDTINPVLSEKQVEAEQQRPERLALEKTVYIDRYFHD